MNKLFLSLAIASLLIACNTNTQNAETTEKTANEANTEATAEEGDELLADAGEMLYRGDTITAEGAITTDEMLALIEGKESIDTKIEAEILSCCQKKGCWMMVDLGNGEEMRVTFKDYGFFVPKNSAGMQVIMEGKAYYDTTSVDMLRHYAEDAGKSQEEIDAITEPELELAFESNGLILLPE